MEQLSQQGYFTEPAIHSLEGVIDYGIGLNAGMVLADLWDLEHFATCKHCFNSRKERLNRANLQQVVFPRVDCSCTR
jgi:hypothetical protein